MAKSNIQYGSDDSGRVWRATVKWDRTVLEVMYPDTNPQWEHWGEMTDSDMELITYEKEINWLKDVIEA